MPSDLDLLNPIRIFCFMSFEGLTPFVFVAVVYSILVEQVIVWVIRKHILVKMKGGWSRFCLVACLLSGSRVILPVMIVVCVEQASLASMGIFPPHSVWVFLAIPLAYLALIVLSLLDDIHRVKGLAQSSQELIERSTPVNYKIEFVNQTVIAGLPEEFLYRGYFLSRLIIGFGTIIGVMLSSIYFGVSHIWSIVKGEMIGDKCKALKTFAGGLIFGIVFIHFGLIPCIIVHFCENMSYGWISSLLLPRLISKT